MTATFNNNYCHFICFEYEPVFLIDAYAAIAAEITFQHLGFSISAFVSVTHDILQQLINFPQELHI